MAFPEHGAPSLLWADIETGGPDPLDERHGFMLEVGFRITDADLNTIAERSWLIPYRAATIDTIRGITPHDVRAMHETSGLWQDLLDNPGKLSFHDASCSQLGHLHGRPVADPITGWLHGHGADGLPLAGSSVHFDRRWLDYWVPGFKDIPHRRNVDVSTLKELLLRWRPDVVAAVPAPARRHRPLQDLDDSIRELAFYRAALGLDRRAASSTCDGCGGHHPGDCQDLTGPLVDFEVLE